MGWFQTFEVLVSYDARDATRDDFEGVTPATLRRVLAAAEDAGRMWESEALLVRDWAAEEAAPAGAPRPDAVVLVCLKGSGRPDAIQDVLQVLWEAWPTSHLAYRRYWFARERDPPRDFTPRRRVTSVRVEA